MAFAPDDHGQAVLVGLDDDVAFLVREDALDAARLVAADVFFEDGGFVVGAFDAEGVATGRDGGRLIERFDAATVDGDDGAGRQRVEGEGAGARGGVHADSGEHRGDGGRGDRHGAAAHEPTARVIRARPRASGDGLAAEVAADVLGEVGGGGVAAVGILLQRLQHDRLDVQVQRGDDRARRRRVFRRDPLDEVPDVRLDERGAAGEHLIEDGAERVDVAARVDAARLAEGLLRRHVLRRSHDHARERQRRAGVDLAREAEVGHEDAEPDGAAAGDVQRRVGGVSRGDESLSVGVVGQKDVTGLDVAVDHSVGVGVVEGEGDVGGDLERRARRKAAHRRDQLVEREPLDEGHRVERAAVVFADLVHRKEVRVLQPRHQTRFAHEAHVFLGIGARPVGEDLQRDGAAEFGVEGAVDHAHAAAAELAAQFVSAEGLHPRRRLYRRRGARATAIVWSCPPFGGTVEWSEGASLSLLRFEHG